MAQIQLSFLPPEYWQDFQKIVLADANHEWPDAHCEFYGRDGQAQGGIDVIVTFKDRAPIGIQAKKRRLYDAAGTSKVNGGLSISEIDRIIGEVDKNLDLRELVIATTALSDTKLQNHVANLNSGDRGTGKFLVRLWFWEHYQSVLNWNADLQAIYYSDLVHRTLGYQPEKHYLMLLRTAFSRPAFTTRLELEDSGEDMARALADTQAAITIGTLNDRNGQRVGQAPIGLGGFTGSTRPHLEECVRLLDAARQSYREASNLGILRKPGHGAAALGLEGKKVARKIDMLRGQALDKLDIVLVASGLEALGNYLADKNSACS